MSSYAAAILDLPYHHFREEETEARDGPMSYPKLHNDKW